MTRATDFARAIYASMGHDQLEAAIAKLRRLVRSLNRSGSCSTADSYQTALGIAIAEREKRRLTASSSEHPACARGRE